MFVGAVVREAKQPNPDPNFGQLRAHSLHPDYLPHSTPIPIPHSTSPTPPPIYRGVLKETVPKDSTQPADQI